jgi:hypothetical protein
MTSERAQAYGRVVATIEDVGPTKLQPDEVERIRAAADTLLFSEDVQAPGVAEALEDVRDLTEHLIESGRWTDERAQRLAADLAACGPLTPVS